MTFFLISGLELTLEVVKKLHKFGEKKQSRHPLQNRHSFRCGII